MNNKWTPDPEADAYYRSVVGGTNPRRVRSLHEAIRWIISDLASAHLKTQGDCPASAEDHIATAYATAKWARKRLELIPNEKYSLDYWRENDEF